MRDSQWVWIVRNFSFLSLGICKWVVSLLPYCLIYPQREKHLSVVVGIWTPNCWWVPLHHQHPNLFRTFSGNKKKTSCPAFADLHRKYPFATSVLCTIPVRMNHVKKGCIFIWGCMNDENIFVLTLINFCFWLGFSFRWTRKDCVVDTRLYSKLPEVSFKLFLLFIVLHCILSKHSNFFIIYCIVLYFFQTFIKRL